MTVSLNSALSGLKAAQKALDTISTNIANASTPGYTRKILPQESLIVQGTGAGVTLNALLRNVDKFLVRDLVKQQSLSSNQAIQQKYLEQIQNFHGSSDQERSLSSSIGSLSDAFTELSSSPDSSSLLQKTLGAAQGFAKKMNDYYSMLNDMRNQMQDEIESNVNTVNGLLDTIAQLNVQIGGISSSGRSTADLEDKRDIALQELSKYIQTSSFSIEDNKIVVMTKQGQVLADEVAHKILFTKTPALPTAYYPGGGLNGLSIDNGNSSIALEAENIGGSLGGLLTMRDTTIPLYQAQADELAQKTAARFDQQGLRLFTDGNGLVPASVDPPATVGYVGFAGQIRVNANIVNDPTLLRTGTYGDTVQTGSNYIISKITDYAFGAYAYQKAEGTVDISSGVLFNAGTGMDPIGKVIGNVNLSSYSPDLSAAPNISVPATFNLTIDGVANAITIGPGETTTSLISQINGLYGAGTAALNGLGQLMITGPGDIQIANGTIGAAGMADLGFTFGTTTATNPSFSVQVGNLPATTITINPTDTATDLLNTLNTIPGITASLGSGGQLLITPTHGGGVTMTNISGDPLTVMGVTVTSVAQTPFRDTLLGPNADIPTGLLSSSTIADYTRSLISTQAEDYNVVKTGADKESSFLDTLAQRHSDESGVDIDQELSELVRIQTAYSAAARMITVSEKVLDELMQAFS